LAVEDADADVFAALFVVILATLEPPVVDAGYFPLNAVVKTGRRWLGGALWE
jgi:hypothetical protein